MDDARAANYLLFGMLILMFITYLYTLNIVKMADITDYNTNVVAAFSA